MRNRHKTQVSYNDWVINQFLKLCIMLKNILKLEGAQELSKKEQKEIKGQGFNDLLACRCPNTGVIVIGHGDNCNQLINILCELDS
jgi:soluble P-type ATPase